MLSMYSVTVRAGVISAVRGERATGRVSPFEQMTNALEYSFYEEWQDLQFRTINELARLLGQNGLAIKPFETSTARDETIRRIMLIDRRRIPKNSDYEVFEVDSLRLGRQPVGIADLIVQKV